LGAYTLFVFVNAAPPARSIDAIILTSKHLQGVYSWVLPISDTVVKPRIGHPEIERILIVTGFCGDVQAVTDIEPDPDRDKGIKVRDLQQPGGHFWRTWK